MFSFCFPAVLILSLQGSERGEEPSSESPPPDFRSALVKPSLAKIALACQDSSPAKANRRFEFQKRSQLFIRTHNETLSVAVSINNPDRAVFKI
jgi:hypothetical protein